MAGPCGLGLGGVVADTARTNVQTQKPTGLCALNGKRQRRPSLPRGGVYLIYVSAFS